MMNNNNHPPTAATTTVVGFSSSSSSSSLTNQVKSFSMPRIPSLSLHHLSNNTNNNAIVSTQEHHHGSSTNIVSQQTNHLETTATATTSSSSSLGSTTPRSIFESIKRKLSRGFLSSPRGASSPTTTNNHSSSSFSSLDATSSSATTTATRSTSFIVVEDDPTLLGGHLHHSVANSNNMATVTATATATTITDNGCMTHCSLSPPTSPNQQHPSSACYSPMSSLSPSSRTNSFSSAYSSSSNITTNQNYSGAATVANYVASYHQHQFGNQKSPITPSSPSSNTSLSSGGGANASSPSLLGNKTKVLTPRKRNSLLSLITNVKATSGGSVGGGSGSLSLQQKAQPPQLDSLFDETIENTSQSSVSPRISLKKKKKSSNSHGNYEEDLSIKTNNLTSKSRNRSKSASNQLDIMPKVSLFTLATSPGINSVLTPNSSILSDSSSASGLTCESPKSISPRISFQRLTLGSANDECPNEYVDTTDDEYRQLMDSESGREIFFNYIQKHAHSEQIDFLQETIRLYQDNASILPKCTSPSSNNLMNDNETFSTSLPDSSHHFSPRDNPSRCFSPPNASYAGSSALFDSTFENQSSVPNFSSSTSSIGTLKKVISKNKLSKQSPSVVVEDRSLISTSEILMRYKQQKMQTIQQSIVTQHSYSPHVFFGFNLYHIENLVNKYILEHSPKELNLSKRQRQKVLDLFEKLKNEKLEFLNKEVYVEGAGVKEIPFTLYTDILVTEEEFVEIFRELISVINLQLKLECFREFRHSKEYLDVILCNMGDVIGVASVVGSMSQDKLEALVSPRRNILNRFGKQRRLSEADLGNSENSGFYPFGERHNIKTPRTMMRNMKNPLELFQLFANIHPHNRQ